MSNMLRFFFGTPGIKLASCEMILRETTLSVFKILSDSLPISDTVNNAHIIIIKLSAGYTYEYFTLL